MPPKVSPKCVECQKTESMLWRTIELGQICQECYEKSLDHLEATKMKEEKLRDIKEKDKDTLDSKPLEVKATDEKSKLRKSTRATRFKAKSVTPITSTSSNGNNATNANSNAKTQSKGRNRRSLFKKIPYKRPIVDATVHSVESVFYKDSYMQIGDIVSLADNSGNIYYAQIRGLLIDDYCEKSAFLTWLIPTQASPDPNESFDAATYLIGPDEELSRKISCLEFVMHAPSNYYHDTTTPFPLPDSMEHTTKPGGYIWTTLPEFQKNKNHV